MHADIATILLVAHSCLTIWDPLDCNAKGSHVQEILQARILEWVAYPFSSRSSRPRNQVGVSCIAGRFFSCWAARKGITNLDSIFKIRDIALLTKVCIVKAMGFLIVMYRCESWTIKKAEHQRIDGFKLWCWRRFLRVPWTATRSNQSIPKEISPEYSLAGLMLKLKLQYFGPLMQRANSLEKTLMLRKIESKRRRGDRGWDGRMASPTQWTWVWANSRR